MEDSGGSWPCPGEVRGLVGLRSQGLGRATRPWGAGLRQAGHGEENNDKLIPQAGGSDGDRINMGWQDCDSSVHKEPRVRNENSASLRDAISSFASHQIHSEVKLDTAFLTQQRGPGLGGMGRSQGHPLLPLGPVWVVSLKKFP